MRKALSIRGGCGCCQNCEKRHIGCHAECADYIAYRSNRDAELKQIFNGREEIRILNKH